MKKSTSDSIFFKLRPVDGELSRASKRNVSQRVRTSRLEVLESRELLSVSVEEYASIRSAYEEFALPLSANDVNIIEIRAEDLSIGALKNALDQAGSTKKDDLIVVRTTNTINTVSFTKASDQLNVELDRDIFGKTTIVALGPKSLIVDAKNLTRALSLAVGTLDLGNVVLQNGKTSNFGGVLLNKGDLTLKNCSVSGGTCANSELGSNLYSSGSLLAVNSSFTNAKGGNAVYATGALTVKDCSIESNAGVGVYVEAEETASFQNVSISRNGSYGLVNKYGPVQLSECSLSENGNAGILNSGDVEISQSVIAQNGGSGIVNQSFQTGETPFSPTVSVDRTKIVGNANVRGAGVYNVAGKATLSNCEISQNVADENGGAVYCEYRPGYNNLATIVNCTIAGNSAASQGGGIYAEPSFGLAIYNTIVSMNFAGETDANVSGSFTSKNNIIGGSASFIVPPLFDFATGRLTNASTINLRLASGSVAYNYGDSSRVANDSKDLDGNPRIYGKSVDAGAYEYRNAGESAFKPQYVVTTLEDSFDSTDGKTSLREALYFASDSNAVITFADDLSGVLNLNSQLIVSSSVTVDGSQRVTIDAQNKSRAFLVEAPLTLVGLTLVNGLSTGNGGLICAKESLTIKNSTLDGGTCAADAFGGLVYAQGNFKAEETVFSNSKSGVALYLSGISSLSKCVVTKSENDAIYTSVTLTATDTSIYQNDGRGIVNYYGGVTLKNVSIYEQTGAGVYNVGSTTMENCAIERNGDSGIVNYSVVVSETNLFISDVYVKNTVVRNNSAQNGAGVYNRFGLVELVNCEISANRAEQAGGGVYNEVNPRSANSVRIINGTVAGNYAGVKGGGVAASQSDALLVLYNSIVAMNLSGDVDANVSCDVSLSSASLIGTAPGFVVAPIFDYVDKTLINADLINLRLASNSVAIDAGSYSYVGTNNKVDLDGANRVYGSNVDLGAYEYQGTSEVAPTPSYVVTTLTDNFNLSDGKTSLREALYWANQKGQTITFAQNLRGTIQLTSQLIVTNDITIDGDSRITLSGQGKTRVMLNEANLTLANIVLTNGSAPSLGNVVYSQGKLTLNNATITKGKSTVASDNGNIYSLETLTVKNSRIAESVTGGGVYALGSVVMTNSVVESNKSYGLFVANNAKLTDCKIQNNGDSGIVNYYGSVELKSVAIANNAGTGLTNRGSATISTSSILDNASSGLFNVSEIYSDTARFSSSLKVYTSIIKGNASTGSGAGIYNLGGLLELDNSEVSANAAQEYGGGVYNVYLQSCVNKANLVNCTIAGNYAGIQGGGIYVDSNSFVLNMYNSIVAGNYSTSPNANVEGFVADSARNVMAGNPSFIVAPVFSDSGVLQNKDALNLRLDKNSVAVDIGVNDYVVGAVDLDGRDRIFNDVVDLGAYEYFDGGSTCVTTLSDVFNLNDGVVTLREAIYYAKSGDVVSFDPSLRGAIVLSTSLEIAKDVQIVGNGAVTISGNDQTQLVKNYATLSISGLTLASGYSETFAGAIYNEGNLSVDNCSFQNNNAKNGGAIYNRKNATASISNSSFADNSATTSGGAVYNGGELTIRNARFTNNEAQENGGAVYCSGQTTIVNSAIVKSKAQQSGGAVYLSSGGLTIVNATIAGNSATSGGGLYINGGAALLYNDVVATNSSDVAGSVTKATANRVLSSFSFNNQAQNYLYDSSKPLFVDAARGNFKLAENSQAIDKGLTQYAREFGIGAYARDLAGDLRYLGSEIDLGAYENQDSVDISVYEGCAFELAVDVASGDKTYWDLSGTGAGEFVKTDSDFWVDVNRQGLTPGLYYLRSKVVGSNGAVKAENVVTLQVLKTEPLVSVEIAPTIFDNAIILSFDTRFLGAIPDHSWRVDWGDGSSLVQYNDAFIVGNFYETKDYNAVYTISLTLVGADGLDERVYQATQFVVPGLNETPSDALLDEALSDFDESFDLEIEQAADFATTTQETPQASTNDVAVAEMFLSTFNQDQKKKKRLGVNFESLQ